jgi:RimJ/RimL family protein N-acetyltransferase
LVLTGIKVILRPLEHEDLKLLHEWQNDEDVMRLARSSPDSAVSMQALETEYEKIIRGEDAFRQVYVIAGKDDKKPIGWASISIHRWTRRSTTGDIGLAIVPASFRKKGYGTEVVELLLKESFEQLNLHRVGWWTYAENVGSIGLAKKMGFKEEARLRENVFFDNQYHDSVVLGLLKEEYQRPSRR